MQSVPPRLLPTESPSTAFGTDAVTRSPRGNALDASSDRSTGRDPFISHLDRQTESSPSERPGAPEKPDQAVSRPEESIREQSAGSADHAQDAPAAEVPVDPERVDPESAAPEDVTAIPVEIATEPGLPTPIRPPIEGTPIGAPGSNPPVRSSVGHDAVPGRGVVSNEGVAPEGASTSRIAVVAPGSDERSTPGQGPRSTSAPTSAGEPAPAPDADVRADSSSDRASGTSQTVVDPTIGAPVAPTVPTRSTRQVDATERPERTAADAPKSGQSRSESTQVRAGIAPSSTETRAPRSGTGTLASLLEAYGGRDDARSKASPRPAAAAAVARAEQVQQAIAIEQAVVNGGSPPASGAAPGSATMGTVDARQDVLTDLSTRESARTALEDRAGKVAARALGALATQRGGTMMMRLDPPSIGELAVRMTVIDGAVRAEMTASTDTARLLLERSLDALRSTLESRGLRVERLAVQGPASGAEATNLRSDGQQQGSAFQGSADDRGDDGQDAAGRESRGRHDDRRGTPGTEEESGSRTFQEMMEQD
jgi:chemotaxis protein MotD